MEPTIVSSKRYCWPRLAAAGIDLGTIFCIFLLLYSMTRPWVYIDEGYLFIFIFTGYFIAGSLFFKGNTIGRELTGLRLVGKEGNPPGLIAILVREMVGKAGIGIIIPSYILGNFSEIKSVFIGIIFQLLAFLLAVIFPLLFKGSWWDWLSGTRMQAAFPRYQNIKPAFRSFGLLWIVALSILLYPVLLSGPDKKSLQYPVYPLTKEVKEYAAFAVSKGQPPVEYVFDLFKKYDIVVLSERMHPECTQYELITQIVSDPRFKNEVGNIMTECGTISLQDTLNTLLSTRFSNEDSLEKKVAELQRNSNGVWPIWNNTNLFDLLKTFNKLNSQLPDSNQLHWYFTDQPVDWTNMSADKFKYGYTNGTRDSVMGVNVVNAYKKKLVGEKRHKALVIMNTRHGYAYKGIAPKSKFMHEYKGTAAFIGEALPGKMANIMINIVSLKYATAFVPVQNGKWDRALEQVPNEACAFNFEGSPFGEDEFDLGALYEKGVRYKDMFTGFIYYKPLTSHINKENFKYLYAGFEDSAKRRSAYAGPDYAAAIQRNIIYCKEHAADPVYVSSSNYDLYFRVIRFILLPALLGLVGLLALIRLRSAKRIIRMGKTVI